MTVTRYTCDPMPNSGDVMVEDPLGEYVLASDYDAAEARAEQQESVARKAIGFSGLCMEMADIEERRTDAAEARAGEKVRTLKAKLVAAEARAGRWEEKARNYKASLVARSTILSDTEADRDRLAEALRELRETLRNPGLTERAKMEKALAALVNISGPDSMTQGNEAEARAEEATRIGYALSAEVADLTDRTDRLAKAATHARDLLGGIAKQLSPDAKTALRAIVNFSKVTHQNIDELREAGLVERRYGGTYGANDLGWVVESHLADDSILSREKLRKGKYTRGWASLTEDQMTALLWLLGEWSIRGGHGPPLSLLEVYALMQCAP